MPVDHRVVKAHAQAFGATGVNILLHNIALQHRTRVKVADLGVEHGKAVTELRREDDVAAAGCLRELRPRARSAGLGLEQWKRGLGVGLRICVHHFLDPFHTAIGGHGFPLPGAGEARVGTDHHEHAEARVSPPSHARVAGLLRLRRRLAVVGDLRADDRGGLAGCSIDQESHAAVSGQLDLDR